MRILFLTIIFCGQLWAGEIVLRYMPETGRVFHYSASVSIHQNLKTLNGKTPSAATPGFADIEIKALFSLFISTSKSGWAETYTLNSITATMNADGYSSNFKNLSKKFTGRSRTIYLSHSGKILKRENGLLSYTAPQIYGRKITMRRKFKTSSDISYPVLGLVINAHTDNYYNLKKIRGGLYYFDFATYVKTASHYRIRKRSMADGDINGDGTGSFVYNRRSCTVEKADAQFSLVSDINSEAGGVRQLLRLLQSAEVKIEKIPS